MDLLAQLLDIQKTSYYRSIEDTTTQPSLFIFVGTEASLESQLEVSISLAVSVTLVVVVVLTVKSVAETESYDEHDHHQQ